MKKSKAQSTNAQCGDGLTCSSVEFTVIVKEGGWNTNDLMIKIDYRVSAGVHPNTLHNGFIRFQESDMSPERLNAIRSIAYLSLATGPRLVWVGTHYATCTRATEISFYDDIN